MKHLDAKVNKDNTMFFQAWIDEERNKFDNVRITVRDDKLGLLIASKEGDISSIDNQNLCSVLHEMQLKDIKVLQQFLNNNFGAV